MPHLGSNRPRNGFRALTGLATLLCCTAPLSAQGNPGQLPRADTIAPPPTAAARPAGGPLLDAPINRSEYRLGPGDLVDVTVFGDVSFQYSVPVTPEGTVVVPSVGVARVLGLTVDAAEDRVRNVVLRLYRNVTVNLTLSQVRSFKVYVLGDVPSPGTRTASAVTRVSEVVPGSARGDTGVVHRNVLLRRASGDSTLVDLARFSLLGDLSANPFLREGDALLVRAVEEFVEVYGRVTFPGKYEYRPGETLAEFLSLVNGGRGFPANAADTIRLSRFAGGQNQQVLPFATADALGATGRALVLRPSDAVFVPEIANFRVQRVATVTGQVVRPGTYPIRPDTTTLRDLVALAGGLTPQASLIGATLRRVVPPQERTRAGALPDSALSSTERQISAIQRQETNLVVINFQALLGEGNRAFDVPVRDGDALDIPERRNEVAVLGAVTQPGLVSYAPGRTVEQYVRLAGWYSRRADFKEAVILRAGTGTQLSAREVRQIDPGDQIVVPFRERRTILQRVQTTQALIGIVSGAAVTIATFIALF